jgi:hypothetical protein
MSDTFRTVLSFVDLYDQAVLDFDYVEWWPERELERYITTGLFAALEPLEYVVCRECGEQSPHKVMFMPGPSGSEMKAYAPCPDCGFVETPLARLQRWRIDVRRLIELAFADLPLAGRRDEISMSRAWRLGKGKWAGAAWNVFFARGLRASDAWKVINEAHLPARSIVFVPIYIPEEDTRMIARPPFVALNQVLSWDDHRLVLDTTYVEDRLASVLAITEGKGRSCPHARCGTSRVVDRKVRA